MKLPIQKVVGTAQGMSGFVSIMDANHDVWFEGTGYGTEGVADQIVHAVNSHEELVAALREAEMTIAEVCVDQHPDNVCCHVLKQVRDALAAVEAA